MSRAVGMFSAVMISGKIELIDKIKKEMGRSGISERYLFSDLMKAVFGRSVGLDPRRLSDELGYSYSSVSRWITGRSAPHRVLWRQVTAWIESSLDAKRDELKALLAS